MSWPVDDLTKTQYDQGTDDPSLARVQLEALYGKVKELLAQTVTDYALQMLAGNNAAVVRTTLGLGSAAVKSTGTDGDYVPLLSGANVWRANQTITNAAGNVAHLGLASYGSYSQVAHYRYNGTEAAPTALTTDDVIGQWFSVGHNGDVSAVGGLIRTVATQPWTATANGCRMDFYATVNDQLLNRKMYLQRGLVVGGPSGGDIGYGTINAQEYYRNGVSLSTLLASAAPTPYRGTDPNNLNFPIGTTLFALWDSGSAAFPPRNSVVGVKLRAGNAAFTINGAGTPLQGTWVSRGHGSASSISEVNMMVQRVW